MPPEADLRAAVVEAAQAMARGGLTVATTGNVSAREGEQVLVTPAGAPYETMKPADIVAIDLDGRVLGGKGPPSSEWRLHVAVYRRRPDIAAIVHAHSPHATAWSFLGEPLDTGTEELHQFAGGPVVTAPFAPTGTGEIAERAADALADRRAVLLARHGVVGCGPTLAAALDACFVVEHQAQVAWLLRGAGALNSG